MSKHTPGPWFGMIAGRFADTDWSAENDDASVSSCAPITDSRGATVAMVVSEKWDDAELDANASLIAAAPDLLEALELVQDCLMKCLTGGEVSAFAAGKALEQSALIIAKARGES